MKWIKKTIDFAEVQADLEVNWEATQFNTSFHDADEAPGMGQPPSEAPYSYKRWLPLILESRGLSPDAVQKITLTEPQTRLLLDACDASVAIGRVNHIIAEDLDIEFAPALSELKFPPEGLFVRLDTCSPKDGAKKVYGKSSLHSVDEVILRLATSERCRSALANCLWAETPVELFFLPFDARMASELEFRVFCRPEGCRITGISQYRWYEPWLFADRPENEQGEIMQLVCDAAKDVRLQIMAEVMDNGGSDALLLKQGMSFDLSFDPLSMAVELVELNTFGIRSACGSCLFQWIKDRKVLYDEADERTVEFRVCV